MDKRKEKTLKEIRKEIGLQLQDRRNFLNCLLNIENYERSILVKQRHIEQMKSQLESGQIEEKDRFGQIMTKNNLSREITFAEFQLQQLNLNLDFGKEDLYYILHTNEGLIDKTGSLEDLKSKINAHFSLMREEYEKVKKVMSNAI